MQPSPHVSNDILQRFIADVAHCFVVIDALDECSPRAEMLNQIRTIRKWRIPNLHLLVTSRQERDIEDALKSFLPRDSTVCLSGDIVDPDIKAFICDTLSHSSKWRSKKQICEEVQNVLCEKSQGMFRWAACQLEALELCVNRKRVHKLLKTLPRTLEETYGRMLLAIDEEDSAYAIRMLRAITFSEHPIQLELLAKIVAIDPTRHPSYDEDEQFDDPSDVLRILGSLVTTITVKPYDSFRNTPRERPECPSRYTVVLAHFSVKEYLLSIDNHAGTLSKYQLLAGPSHTVLAKGYISYLLQSEFGNTWDHFTQHAAKSWVNHIRALESPDDETISLTEKFISHRTKGLEVSDFFNEVEFSFVKKDWRRKNFLRPLFYATWLNLPVVISRLLSKYPLGIACSTSRGNTLLSYAARMGNTQIVNVLLERGSQCDQLEYGSEGAPLCLATWGCHIPVIKSLIAAGASAHFEKAVEVAIVNRKFASLQALAECEIGAKALSEFINKQHPSLAFSIKDAWSWSCADDFSMMEYLMQRGAQRYVNAEGTDGLSLLHVVAVQHGPYGWIQATIQVLMRYGCNINIQNSRGQTALHLIFTSRFGSEIPDLFEFLIANGADITLVDKYGRGLSHYAIKASTTLAPALTMLQSSEVNIHQGDIDGNTPLHYAALRHSTDQIETLLKFDADVNSRNKFGMTPLHLASSTPVRIGGSSEPSSERMPCDWPKWTTIGPTLDSAGSVESFFQPCTMEALIRHGADPSATDDFGNTPLHYAARRLKSHDMHRIVCDVALTTRNSLGHTPRSYIGRLLEDIGNFLASFDKVGDRLQIREELEAKRALLEKWEREAEARNKSVTPDQLAPGTATPTLHTGPQHDPASLPGG
ncbi:ankyrin [Byssothecium circinans]|uniref:Ankyrin n=1 Tax=Byssothecium circinans TaxID=147558 RepID=A0A6A5TST0_9PLEO|nr:ankyrin [Byssothecium circinans]